MNKQLLGLALTAGILTGCGDGQTHPSNKQAAASTSQKQAEPSVSHKALAKSYALRGTDNSWPPLSPEAENISENLLTKNYYIVLDGSGSMADVSCSNGKTRLAAAKTAVNTFINNIPSDADVGLMMFDQNGTKERVELGFGERSDIIRQVSASRPGGGTPLSSAVRTGYHALAAKAVQQLGYGEYNLVIVTDGEASGGQNPRKDVNALLAKSPITIHTIGFCIKGNHSLNQQGLTIYKSAKDPNSLSQGLSEVLAESPDFNVGSFQEG